jgi:alanine-glyoxylate transaminase/serine-glyoxylate transaminase/serine-pyruvate transaminase
VRQAVKAWGLELCARERKWYSDTVSAIMVPKGIDGADLVDMAYRKYNTALGAGLIEVAGKLFRIGHLGDLNEVSCCAALAAAEMAMLDLGAKIKPGTGVGAALEYYRKHALVYREGHQLKRRATDTRVEIREPATAKMRKIA